MTYNHSIHMSICDDCHQAKPNMIETYWAAAADYRHYCKQCWPRYRDYYEGESGRQAWKRIGDRYVPID
jgi:hypothetical protein